MQVIRGDERRIVRHEVADGRDVDDRDAPLRSDLLDDAVEPGDANQVELSIRLVATSTGQTSTWTYSAAGGPTVDGVKLDFVESVPST